MSGMHVKKGDKVIVIAGKDKGKQGIVLSVSPKEKRIIVSGINLVRRHTKPSNVSEGGIVEKESAIHVSNVMHLDPKDGTPTRIGRKLLDDGRKVRFARKSGEVIDL